MTTLVLLIHFLICAGLIGLILLQRSEGGALGIGGGGPGGLMSGRGAANLLTRSTSILALGFFITSIALTVLTNRGGPTSVVDRVDMQQPAQEETQTVPAEEQTPQPVIPEGE